MPADKEKIRQIILKNDLKSVTEFILFCRWTVLRTFYRESWRLELDESFGYEKNHKEDLQTDNKYNGHFQRSLKSQYGEVQIEMLRDWNGEFELNLIPRYQRTSQGLKKK